MTYEQIQWLMKEGKFEQSLLLLSMTIDEIRGDIALLQSSKKKEDEDACRRQSKVNEDLSPQSPSLSKIDDRSEIQNDEIVGKENPTPQSMHIQTHTQTQLNQSYNNIKTFR